MGFEVLINRVETRCKELNMAVSTACHDSGVGRGFINDLRNGKNKNPGLDTIEKLARYLKTSSLWLLGGEEEGSESLPLNENLLEDAITALMAHTKGKWAELPPLKMARSVSALYELSMPSGKVQGDSIATVLRLVGGQDVTTARA